MGIVSIERFSNGSALGLWQITESVDSLFASLRLSEAELARFAEIKTGRRKKEWLACRNLVRLMTDTGVEISYNRDGKPEIQNSDFHISISHSESYACVYIKKTGPCGVDIQKLKKSISAGADFFIADQERKWVDLSDNFQMHLIWSAKEAAFKYAGIHDIDFKNNILLKPFQSNQNEPIQVTLLNQQNTTKISLRYLFFEQYVLVWTL
jgi:4'-phosphopantetheinyl transferase